MIGNFYDEKFCGYQKCIDGNCSIGVEASVLSMNQRPVIITGPNRLEIRIFKKD